MNPHRVSNPLSGCVVDPVSPNNDSAALGSFTHPYRLILLIHAGSFVNLVRQISYICLCPRKLIVNKYDYCSRPFLPGPGLIHPDDSRGLCSGLLLLAEAANVLAGMVISRIKINK